MSIKVSRFDPNCPIWLYAGEYGNPFWGDPSFLISWNPRHDGLETWDFGHIKTSKHFGHADTACDHLSADGSLVILPDDMFFTEEPILDPWTGEELSTSISLHYPAADGQRVLGNILMVVNIGMKSFSSRWVAHRIEYYSDDWATPIGKAPMYAGAQLHKGVLSLWFPTGLLERFELDGKGNARHIGSGECIYTTISDMENMLSDANGYVWEGLYRYCDLRSCPNRSPGSWFCMSSDFDIRLTKPSYLKAVSEKSDIRDTVNRRIQLLDGANGFSMTPLLNKAFLSWYSLDNIRYLSVNSLAFIEDLKKLKATFTPLLRVWKKPLNPKSWSNLWLSYRYGIRLTISDVLEISDAVEKWSKSKVKPFGTCRSRFSDSSVLEDGTEVDIEVHQKVYYTAISGPVDKLVHISRQWDLYPSWENLWDLVPLSFVVDWFVKLNDILHKVDLGTDLDRLPIEYVLYSSKVTAAEGKPRVTSQTCLQLVAKNYQRWSESSLTSPIKPPDKEQAAALPFHIIDGTSLLIQRLSR